MKGLGRINADDLAAAVRQYRRDHRVPRTHDVEAWRSSEGIYEVFTRLVSSKAFRRQQMRVRAGLEAGR